MIHSFGLPPALEVNPSMVSNLHPPTRFITAAAVSASERRMNGQRPSPERRSIRTPLSLSASPSQAASAVHCGQRQQQAPPAPARANAVGCHGGHPLETRNLWSGVKGDPRLQHAGSSDRLGLPPERPHRLVSAPATKQKRNLDRSLPKSQVSSTERPCTVNAKV